MTPVLVITGLDGWMICCSSFRLDDPLHGDVTDECLLDIDIRLAAPVPHKDFYRELAPRPAFV